VSTTHTHTHNTHAYSHRYPHVLAVRQAIHTHRHHGCVCACTSADRVGGRVWTDPGTGWDLGASWLYSPDTHPLYQVATA
jgi:hypothetical protein